MIRYYLFVCRKEVILCYQLIVFFRLTLDLNEGVCLVL